MKLKLIKYPRPGQTDMIVAGKEVALNDSVEVSDEEGQSIQLRWPNCFEAESGGKVEKVKAEPKQAKEYKNKAVTSEQ